MNVESNLFYELHNSNLAITVEEKLTASFSAFSASILSDSAYAIFSALDFLPRFFGGPTGFSTGGGAVLIILARLLTSSGDFLGSASGMLNGVVSRFFLIFNSGITSGCCGVPSTVTGAFEWTSLFTGDFFGDFRSGETCLTASGWGRRDSGIIGSIGASGRPGIKSGFSSYEIIIS